MGREGRWKTNNPLKQVSLKSTLHSYGHKACRRLSPLPAGRKTSRRSSAERSSPGSCYTAPSVHTNTPHFINAQIKAINLQTLSCQSCQLENVYLILAAYSLHCCFLSFMITLFPLFISAAVCVWSDKKSCYVIVLPNRFLRALDFVQIYQPTLLHNTSNVLQAVWTFFYAF